MKRSQIAAQLYTVRNFIQTPGGVDRSFAKLRKIGFEAVQVSGTPVAPKEIKRAADANGLTICAAHDGYDSIVNHTPELIEKLKTFQCLDTAFSCPLEHQVIDYGASVELAQALNRAAEELNRHGLCLSYHNHNIEFRRVNGERIIDVIYASAPALKAEFDTYWVQMGGCNPAKIIRNYAGRQNLLHLKEMGVVYPHQTDMVPLGSGNLDWKEIIAAGEDAGVGWFIIEQDNCQKDPFDSLEESFAYLTGLAGC